VINEVFEDTMLEILQYKIDYLNIFMSTNKLIDFVFEVPGFTMIPLVVIIRIRDIIPAFNIL
jgi:hypothetical protein